MTSLSKILILGVGVTNAKEQDILEFITKGLEKKDEKFYVVTPNPEILVIANKNSYYKKVLNGAKIALPDGIGVVWGAQLLGKQLQERITGVDFVKSLCKHIANRPITVSFLGGRHNIAELTAECLVRENPGLKVVWAYKDWENALKSKYTDILFVAFGSPKQEIWIKEHFSDIPAKVIIGVGGSFDFISGKIPRAPELLRNLGLEWLFRLLIQPWRIKRQFSLLKYIYLIVKEKLR
ncbi:MAG: hypothetical protein A3B38_02440 [Candidatus Levybacteria bacterium RIFCSPLOWO2_01_FULL_36_13]|nr:MAG: hypothetical protein A2684_03635 [Candidatus Levybacteria bacterium RIFCSPHIGHO2_01_FULL_36_15b]OGH35143.1 MAG: hypothetical protein A3B38_02440 [Candidatus Levybacteria bacterium RIFCSPLOWO2_01_FULL_36_13]